MIVEVQAVRRDLRRADNTLAQVLNKIVRGLAVALAGAVADDRPRSGCQRNVGVLVPKHRRGLARAFLWIALVADIGPQLVALDPVDVKADHHAVVQFYAAAADASAKAGNGLAISASEAADGALADALTERADNFNLLSRERIFMAGAIRHIRGMGRDGNSEPIAAIFATVGCQGAQSRG